MIDNKTLADTCYEIEMWAASNRKELGGSVDFGAVQEVVNMARLYWFQNARKESNDG